MEETGCRNGTQARGWRCAPDFNKTSCVSSQKPWQGNEFNSLFTQTRSEEKYDRWNEKKEENVS